MLKVVIETYSVKSKILRSYEVTFSNIVSNHFRKLSNQM